MKNNDNHMVILDFESVITYIKYIFKFFQRKFAKIFQNLRCFAY